MNIVTVMFLVFLLIEIVGGIVFIFLFRYKANWDLSPISVNLLAYSAALTLYDILFFLAIVNHAPALAYLLLGSHIPISILIWWRNVLLVKSLKEN